MCTEQKTQYVYFFCKYFNTASEIPVKYSENSAPSLCNPLKFLCNNRSFAFKLFMNVFILFINKTFFFKKNLCLVLSATASVGTFYASTVEQLWLEPGIQALFLTGEEKDIVNNNYTFLLPLSRNIRQVLNNLDAQKFSHFCLSLQQILVLRQPFSFDYYKT